MQKVFQLENNEIVVSKDNKTYADTLSNFKLDYAACPTFANAFIMYNRSLSQYVLDGTIQTYAAQEDLDTIIDDIDSIITAQNARISATYKYCASNYGTVITEVASTYTAASGETLFSSTPTTAQLTAAYPSTAGTCTYTVTANSVAGDTITFSGITLTATASTTDANDYAVGADISSTVTNIVGALNANKTFASIYKATASNSTFSITEIIKGNGNTPSTISCTGTITISNGTATTSVYGYITAYINQQLTSLNSIYDTQMQQIIRGLNVATLSGTSTANYTVALADLKSWLDTETEAIING